MPVEYNEDFHAWTQETAKALSEGPTEGMDLRQVAEEIEDIGKSERRAALKTGSEPETFPERCTFSLDDVLRHQA
jgi:hypothetical protein